jgi:hypothetical protein
MVEDLLVPENDEVPRSYNHALVRGHIIDFVSV